MQPSGNSLMSLTRLSVSADSHRCIFAKQCTGFARFHIGLSDVHAVNLDAFAAGLPDHVHTVVDHECHGIRLIVVFDDLRDITRHVGEILRVSVFDAQLDEACAPAQCVIDDVVIGRPLQSCGPTTK